MGIESFRKELKNINLGYEEKIDIPDVSFGIELEFSGALFDDVDRNLDELLGYRVSDCEELEKIKYEKEHYQKWRLVDDITVQDNSNSSFKKGGEINSPILRNEKQCWFELKRVCEMLRIQKNIGIDERCSIHIHTDLDIYKELQELKNLVKLYILYEDIINRFAYGVANTPRKTLKMYAKPFGGNVDTVAVLRGIDNVESPREILELIRREEYLHSIENMRDKEFKKQRSYGLNLTNIIKPELSSDLIGKDKIRTLEKRIYKSTLCENMIQNYIIFDFGLLDYAKIENFDSEFIDYRIKSFRPMYINEFGVEKPEKADEFFNMICKNDSVRLRLFKQYYKEYNENDIEKSIHL